MQSFPRTIAAAGLATLLLTGCGSTAEPEPAEAMPTESDTPEPTPTEAAETTQAPDAAPETVEVTQEPPPQAEAGLLLPKVTDDVTRTGSTPVAAGTFGTPAGTLEINAVDRAATIPGALVGGNAPAYTAAEGEEFFVFDVTFVASEDRQAPATELHVDSEGAKRLVTELSPGENTFVVSLPSDAEGARLLVSADGHDQVFDIAAGERAADPLTDVYLRSVTEQDLTEVLTYGPLTVGADGDRDYTGDIRLRSARITPYVPQDIGSQRWAEPGSMWLILDYEANYDSSRSGWSEQNATLTWSPEGAEKVVQDGRLWGGSADEVVLSIPDDAQSFALEVANRLELRALGDGEGIADFGSRTFTLSFPNAG